MLRLFNTRTRSVETFAPDAKRVRVYVCGLTPSAEAHLGHARSFLFFDVLRRYLRHARNGYDVFYVQNVTDVDDRSIATAAAEGRSFGDVVAQHFTSFKRSMQRLGVEEPDSEPHATQYVEPMVEMIQALVDGGAAYVSADGVYFSVKEFPRYGQLAHRNIDELLAGARVAVDEQKRDALDFALWKFAKTGEPAWPSPYGAGRPGWHIECSAMAHVLLGEPFEIHGGGYDLVFPHHENEIAQTETYLQRAPMATTWVHGGLLLFAGRKMSKSLGNFEPLSALLDRIDPLAIRLLFLQTGYRKPMNYTEESVAGAAIALERLRKAYRAMREPSATAAIAKPELAGYRERFFAALDDDMNTAGALGVLFELSNAGVADAERADTAAFMREALEIFGIASLLDRADDLAERDLDPQLVGRLAAAIGDAVRLNGGGPESAIGAVIAARNAARKERDFALADRLRLARAAERIVLKDSKDDTTWTIGE